MKQRTSGNYSERRCFNSLANILIPTTCKTHIGERTVFVILTTYQSHIRKRTLFYGVYPPCVYYRRDPPLCQLNIKNTIHLFCV